MIISLCKQGFLSLSLSLSLSPSLPPTTVSEAKIHPPGMKKNYLSDFLSLNGLKPELEGPGLT